jgi:hypothetical protein
MCDFVTKSVVISEATGHRISLTFRKCRSGKFE